MSKAIRVLNIRRKREKLQRDYLPFVRKGGFFVKSDSEFEVGDELLLCLTATDDVQAYVAFGRVVWAGPIANRQRRIGVEFRELGDGARFIRTDPSQNEVPISAAA